MTNIHQNLPLICVTSDSCNNAQQRDQVLPTGRNDTVNLIALQVEHGVQISVLEQGRGIPKDKLESIFDRFQQVDASDARQKGGTGLGLAICRNLIQQHGGRIWAESEIGQGSQFHIFLPM